VKKKLYIILSFIVIFILAISWLSKYPNPIFYVSDHNIEGTVSKRPYGYWGIEEKSFIGSEKISTTNLPKEFQEEGLKIMCGFTTVDVIGSGDWDQYVEVNNCKLKID
jgi:hypothetical protein